MNKSEQAVRLLMDLEFRVLKPIKSLPPWPGARWNALFRLVAKSQSIDPEEAFEALIPEGWCQSPWRADDSIMVRLVADSQKKRTTESFLEALKESHQIGEGEFVLGRSLELVSMSIPYLGDEEESSDSTASSQDDPSQENPYQEDPWPPLDENLFRSEIEALENIDSPWRLVLTSPLRIVRPANAPGFSEYSGEEYFGWPKAMEHMITRIRLPETKSEASPSPNGNPLNIMSTQTTWRDLAYSRERQMRLGGLTGTILIDGWPDSNQARRLVWGQYLGMGKNARFGFGFYRIPALDSIRSLSCFPILGK
ncbi:MAG: hypothetical protein LBE31_07520 [Deltaproteobacteria bacterium]|jgi:hypothetical protein|nr:hypothetical protein [Deltaproteobacteria bacterium]